jgi:hypothetical protein
MPIKVPANPAPTMTTLFFPLECDIDVIPFFPCVFVYTETQSLHREESDLGSDLSSVGLTPEFGFALVREATHADREIERNDVVPPEDW